jgi:hypothetical protein
VCPTLNSRHYLGEPSRGFALADDFGILVFANPNSRYLPHDRWLELIRWCLYGEKNAGSQQWSRAVRWLRRNRPNITTIVSYSDPSVGHTGALYKACNWRWAPTWHRLRPPPSGNGSWREGKQQSVKDRWVFPLRQDAEREEILRVKDDALMKEIGTDETA